MPVIVFLCLFQCSFIPRFAIHIETKYEDNNGTNENVSLNLNYHDILKIAKVRGCLIFKSFPDLNVQGSILKRKPKLGVASI